MNKIPGWLIRQAELASYKADGPRYSEMTKDEQDHYDYVAETLNKAIALGLFELFEPETKEEELDLTKEYLQKKSLFETISLLNDLSFTATGLAASFYFGGSQVFCVIYTRDDDTIHPSAIEMIKTLPCVKSVKLPSENSRGFSFGYEFILES